MDQEKWQGAVVEHKSPFSNHAFNATLVLWPWVTLVSGTTKCGMNETTFVELVKALVEPASRAKLPKKKSEKENIGDIVDGFIFLKETTTTTTTLQRSLTWLASPWYHRIRNGRKLLVRGSIIPR